MDDERLNTPSEMLLKYDYPERGIRSVEVNYRAPAAYSKKAEIAKFKPGHGGVPFSTQVGKTVRYPDMAVYFARVAPPCRISKRPTLGVLNPPVVSSRNNNLAYERRKPGHGDCYS